MSPSSKPTAQRPRSERDPKLEFADWIRSVIKEYGITQSAIAEYKGIRDKNKITKDLSGKYLPSWQYVEDTYLGPVEKIAGRLIPTAERTTGLTKHRWAAQHDQPHEPVSFRQLEAEVQRLREAQREAEARVEELRRQLSATVQREVELRGGGNASGVLDDVMSEREAVLNALVDDRTVIKELQHRIDEQARQLRTAWNTVHSERYSGYRAKYGVSPGGECI